MVALADLDIVSHSADQTRRLGMHLGKILTRGDVVLMEGEFGSGKTTFTQGLARGLGIDERYVNSPTFTLINEYKAPGSRLYHIDLYRLEGEAELSTLGLEDYFDGSGITVIEWPAGAAPWLPPDYLTVKLHHINDTKRSLRFYAKGDRYQELMEEFRRTAFG